MQKNILIIEDEKSIQNVLKAFLEESGYQITLADDGIEGIAAFHKTKYDLVLLDIMMPKLDGYTVCEMIRKESSTPVILLTALDDEESQMKGFDLLADDYITKPFSMPLVMRRIEAVLRRTQNGQEEIAVFLKDSILHVSNSGVWIPDADLRQIFEPFYRADQSRSWKTGGSGLGLYIVKMILDRHELKYSLENTR